jgi:hypothetical protein
MADQCNTRPIINAGAKVIVDEGVLTNSCGTPWDGVMILGNYFAEQLPALQGSLVMKNSVISNARTGILTAEADLADPLGAFVKESTGGMVRAMDCTFLNNLYDAVFKPYEHRAADGSVLMNTSLFQRCAFATNGGVLATQGDFSALAALAQAEESASTHPERYTLLKHYAQSEQQQGWSEADEAFRTWLSNLGQQRDVLGSAWANAWLHA